jgi:hypothetical protein
VFEEAPHPIINEAAKSTLKHLPWAQRLIARIAESTGSSGSRLLPSLFGGPASTAGPGAEMRITIPDDGSGRRRYPDDDDDKYLKSNTSATFRIPYVV